jgi:GTP-binding protein
MLKVALVGRPNVGKSTLFNRLLGYQHSIVEKTPGVTRDRIEGICSWRGKSFVLVDTGGIQELPGYSLQEKVLVQVDEAIQEAHLILFLIDAKEGIHPDDLAVSQRLRKKNKKGQVLLVANKIDFSDSKKTFPESYGLGFGSPFPISALHGIGIGDLLDEILDRLSKPAQAPPSPLLRFCVVGRPNVGKSSIVNALLGQPRVIVHEEPGTTRDVVDTTLSFGENLLVLADTAGLRKKGKAKENIEFFSRTRTIRAIRQSDVVLLVLEAPMGVMAQDKKIAGEIFEAQKGMIVVANKWDLVSSKSKEAFLQHVRNRLSFVPYAPVLFASALTKEGILDILPKVLNVYEAWRQNLDPKVLQNVLSDAFFLVPPPSQKGEKFNMKTAFPIGSAPPAIVIKGKNSATLPSSYVKFLEGKLREVFPLEGTPLQIKVETTLPKKKRKAS